MFSFNSVVFVVVLNCLPFSKMRFHAVYTRSAPTVSFRGGPVDLVEGSERTCAVK